MKLRLAKIQSLLNQEKININIFILDQDPVVAAQYQCDKHVVKMVLETAQMLSTAHRTMNDSYDPATYKATHINHPCNVWLRQSKQNYKWLYEHFEALSDEYTFRYNKVHKSWEKLRDVLRQIPPKIPEVEQTPFALAMPDGCKDPDPVAAYRKYYVTEKKDLLTYRRRPKPEWI